MTETSMFWDGLVTGDAVISPYDAATEFARVINTLAGALNIPNLGGVLQGNGDDFALTGASSPMLVGTGYAVVWGTWYHNDAAVSVVVSTPVSSTRIDRVVLRKDWVAQTVRIVLIAGVEGGSEPALVQVQGTTWDIPIAKLTITTGASITVVDERGYLPIGLRFTPVTPDVAYEVVLVLLGPSASGDITLPIPNNAIAVSIRLIFQCTTGTAAVGDIGSIAMNNTALTAISATLWGTATNIIATDTGTMKVTKGSSNHIHYSIAGNGGATYGLTVSVLGWYTYGVV